MPRKKPHPAEEKLHNLKLKEMRYHHFIYNLYRKLFVAETELKWARQYLYANLTEEDGVNLDSMKRVDKWFADKWKEYGLELSGGDNATRLVQKAKDEISKRELRDMAKERLKDRFEYEIVHPDVDDTINEINEKLKSREK